MRSMPTETDPDIRNRKVASIEAAAIAGLAFAVLSFVSFTLLLRRRWRSPSISNES